MDLKVRRMMNRDPKPMNADMMMNPAQEKAMVNPEIRTPSYWYKQHEVSNERRKDVPNTIAMNAMMYQNLRKQNLPYLTREQIKLQDRQDQIALQLKAEFMRPRAVVFDSQGKFHRTRVDEQSFL